MASNYAEQQLFSLYDDTVVQAACRIFNSYSGKRMSDRDRLEAVIELARAHPRMPVVLVGDVLTLLDSICGDDQITEDDVHDALKLRADEAAA